MSIESNGLYVIDLLQDWWALWLELCGTFYCPLDSISYCESVHFFLVQQRTWHMWCWKVHRGSAPILPKLTWVRSTVWIWHQVPILSVFWKTFRKERSVSKDNSVVFQDWLAGIQSLPRMFLSIQFLKRRKQAGDERTIGWESGDLGSSVGWALINWPWKKSFYLLASLTLNFLR